MYMVNNGENNIFDESVVNHGDFHGLFTWSTDQGSVDHGQYSDSATCNTNSNPLKKRWYPQ